MIQHSPSSLLMSMPSCSGCQVFAVWLLSTAGFCSHHRFRCNKGIKPPLCRWWGFLLVWGGSTLHVREVDVCSSLFLTWGYLPITPPSLILLTITQFPEWSHWSWGLLSNGIYGQWHHSLSQMHVSHLMSTAMSHYLWSSPILCGYSGGCPLLCNPKVV